MRRKEWELPQEPKEVVDEIQAETYSQLSAKTELIVSQVARPAGLAADETYAALVTSQNAQALEDAFNGMAEQGRPEDDEVNEMGLAIVQLPEMKQEIEPLVQLLASYATARLQDGDGS